MYYRVAIQDDYQQTLRWRSTALSSLDALLHFLRLCHSWSFDKIRVFCAHSNEELHVQFSRENSGLEVYSVTATQFLEERLIKRSDRSGMMPAPVSREVHSFNTARTSVARDRDVAKMSFNTFDLKRDEIERCGPGGDHDVPYSFALPDSWSERRAWLELLAKVHAGILLP